ncbi:hypothetical protein PFDG_05203 [Plasmodium falciparum Dd2]|uniref:Uncharacterized protein n=1 Tax=Plasmodium falciparum (isolate Dd2) TaxID=57267 RepID=A0A0L7M9W8_PLAF4|nr:hypothetical protein PFDG_05203 [Plasmodium falciparum Dd2]
MKKIMLKVKPIGKNKTIKKINNKNQTKNDRNNERLDCYETPSVVDAANTNSLYVKLSHEQSNHKEVQEYQDSDIYDDDNDEAVDQYRNYYNEGKDDEEVDDDDDNDDYLHIKIRR